MLRKALSCPTRECGNAREYAPLCFEQTRHKYHRVRKCCHLLLFPPDRRTVFRFYAVVSWAWDELIILFCLFLRARAICVGAYCSLLQQNCVITKSQSHPLLPIISLSPSQDHCRQITRGQGAEVCMCDAVQPYHTGEKITHP